MGSPFRRRGPGLLAPLAVLSLIGLSLIVLGSCSLAGVPPAGPTDGTRDGGNDPERRPSASSPERPAAVAPGEMARTMPRRFSETRGLWVVRTTLAHPDSVRAMVRRADEAGFNTLLVQIRGRGDAFYRGGWEPRAELLRGRSDGYDPLAVAVQEAHDRGMAVHAWINTHLVASPARPPDDPSHLLNARPDLLAVPRDLARRLYGMDPRDPEYARALVEYARENSDRVEGVYSSPSHPEVKEHVHAIWTDVAARYAVDGMHFDYIRYPGPEFDYSRGALHRFRSWVWSRLDGSRRQALEAEFRDDPLAYVEALPEAWDEFRREQIDGLVTRVYHGVKKRRPEVLVSAAVFANRDDAFRFRYQDWRRWLREGVVDVVVPMAYTADDGVFRGQIRDAVGAAGSPDRVWAGIGAYRNSPEGTLSKIEAARELGVGGVVLFSYDWAAGQEGYLDRVGREAWGG